jgi:hypothetical protein
MTYDNIEYGVNCRVHDCTNTKLAGTQACEEHKNQWRKYVESHSHQNLAGVKRALQGANENLAWQPG